MKIKWHLSIRLALTWLAVGVSALLLLLLAEDIVLLAKLDDTQTRERHLSAALVSALEAQNLTNSAVMSLHAVATTGDLQGAIEARTLIDKAKGVYAEGSPPERADQLAAFLALIDELQTLGEQMARTYLFEGREAGNRIMADPESGFGARSEAVLDRIQTEVQEIRTRLESNRQEALNASSQARWVLITSTALLLILVPIAFFLLYRKLMGSIGRMMTTVMLLGHSDFSARCRLDSGDEMQVLGDAFDRLLDERVAQLARIEEENNAMNDSIIQILEATSQLSQHDLRVNAPVAEDITGAISDAINAAVADVAEVLAEVRTVSEEVRHSSGTVDQQAHKVFQVAQRNLATVDATLKQLHQASESMEKVMALAMMCHNVAGTASQSTREGLESVLGATEGMNRIRTAIQETSKRIKRLGERSQEISGIVGIIKDIAERTHVLALNARIQASTAGEAGRGFSVVADEVKQLAESSRNATAQIATLIQNIQVETADTIATMEQTVSEVVAGTELSHKAREQMTETQQTTQRLAEAVKQIAVSSKQQVRMTRELAGRADEMRESAMHTQRELEAQRHQSERLNALSARLAKSVGQFVLPGAE